MKRSRIPLVPLAIFLLAAGAADSHALFGFGRKSPPLPTPTAMIASVSGSVLYQARGSGPWTAAAANKSLEPGDVVKTEANGLAIISFSDGSKTQITKNSTFAVEALEPRKIGVKIDVGLLEAWVKKVAKRRFQTRTPTAVASVRGTEFRVEVDPSGGSTWDLFGGGLDLTNNFGQTTSFDAGQRVATDPSGTITPPAPIPPTVTPTPEPAVPTPAPKEAPQEGAAPKEGPKAVKIQIVSFTGRLIITTPDGKTIIVEPGKPIPEIPPGSKIEVADGTAVLSVGGSAVQAGTGAKLTISETGEIAAATGSTAITVTQPDGTATTLEAGQTTTAAAETTTTEAAPTEAAPAETTTTEPPPPNPTQETTTSSPSAP